MVVEQAEVVLRLGEPLVRRPLEALHLPAIGTPAEETRPRSQGKGDT